MLKLKLRIPKSIDFLEDDSYEGSTGDWELVREVDKFLKSRNQMGLLVGGVLSKQLPRKDLDVIVTGCDIEPEELGVDWWWIDGIKGDSRNVCGYRINVPGAAKRALAKRLPGLHILTDLYDVKNQDLPATYTTLGELEHQNSSQILDSRLFTPIEIQYQDESLIGILQAYDDTHIELADLVAIPTDMYGNGAYGFRPDFYIPDEGGISEEYTPSQLFLKRLSAHFNEDVDEQYVLWALERYDPEKGSDKKADEVLELTEQFRSRVGEVVNHNDERECYLFIRDNFGLEEYFSELVRVRVSYFQKNVGRYIGTKAINKLAIGEIR
ncbi:hypothetical protein ACFL3V_02310 [Nanoarchaeota archaeon]